MIIRQECLLSLEEITKGRNQSKGRLTRILAKLPTQSLERQLRKESRKGPEGYAPESMLLSLVAMRVMGLRYISDLVQQLDMNPTLRYLCGFSVLGRTPSEATYSRFLKKIAEKELPQQLFDEMLAKFLPDIDCRKVAVDASAIEARENSFAKDARRKTGEPPSADKPSWGVKSGTPLGRGKSHWYGWKLHLAIDADRGIPLAFTITTAAVHDTVPAAALCEKAQALVGGKAKHFLLDKSYDTEKLHLFIRDTLRAAPIIPLQTRRNPTPAPHLDKHCAPVCSLGYSMVYWGFDGIYHKFRCPHVCGKVDCPMGSRWCSNSNYGFVVKQKANSDPRKFGVPHRCSRTWKQLYKVRNQVERCFALLKSFCSLNLISHKGLSKVSAMIALSLVVLLASF